MMERPTNNEKPINPALEPWPDRLKASALLLCKTSLALQAILLDESRFNLLTHPANVGDYSEDDFSEQTASEIRDQADPEIREFDRLLDTALISILDLTGYYSPDREYPDFSQWFKLECPNANYGRHKDTLVVIPSKTLDGFSESASEVIKAALLILERDKQQYDTKKAMLSAAVIKSVKSGIMEEDIIAEIRQEFDLK